jgi:hypothetical protein
VRGSSSFLPTRVGILDRVAMLRSVDCYLLLGEHLKRSLVKDLLARGDKTSFGTVGPLKVRWKVSEQWHL